MTRGCATIITRIDGNQHAEALKHFLRTEVDPAFVPGEAREILKCRPRFPFDGIGSLHFCSFAVLDSDAEFPPSLVFEATFDGSRDGFLEALLHAASGAIDEIYRHCEGYPASGSATPELVKKYLASHDEGAHALYLGNPGRTVAQIKDEAQIYDSLTDAVYRSWSRDKAMPATVTGILQELQDVICSEPGRQWAAQATAAMPWEVAWRTAVPLAAVLTALGAACLLGWGVVVVSGLCDTRSGQTCVDMMGNLLFSRQEVRYLTHDLHLSNGYLVVCLGLSVLIVIWLGLRLVELWFRILINDSRRHTFWLRVSIHILIILRYFLIAVFVMYSALTPAVIWNPSFGHTVLLLFVAGTVIVLCQHWLTSLKLAVQFRELEPRQEIWRCLAIDILRVGMVVTVTFTVVVLTRPVFLGNWFEEIFQGLIHLMSFPITLAMKLTIYAVVGAIAAYAIGGSLLARLRINECRDAHRFSGADELAAFDNSGVYAREEGGINTYQNHLVSLTHVKPGLLPVLSLRLTLLAVRLLSRFWYNNGKLGGISTILSARWVVIDGGRRLLFLDHYSGAWNSYLNEFIDMTAVFGLNAIWTNTFISVRGSRYGFPETEYYFWKGAQAEQPFKAYVRHSQIETLAWYSAYPTVSTVNVNTNAGVRQSLFMPLVSCEIDALLQEL